MEMAWDSEKEKIIVRGPSKMASVFLSVSFENPGATEKRQSHVRRIQTDQVGCISRAPGLCHWSVSCCY